MQDNFDFVVVGAGIAGLSAAYFLSQSARVAVIEREATPGCHASGRSAAVFIEAYDNPTVSDLSLQSKPFFSSPPAGFTDYPLVQPLGGLMLIRPDETTAAADYLAKWSERCPKLGLITTKEAVERVPILKRSAIAGAIYDPNLMAIDTNQLMQCFLRGIRKNGSKLFCATDVRLTRTPTNLWQVSGADISFASPTLINAGGAWANDIANSAGIATLPITPCRRTAFIIDIATAGFGGKAPPWPMVRTLRQDLYFKPEDPGLLISPQDETPAPACDAQPEELDIAIAANRFEILCQFKVSSIKSSWAGLRSITPDRRPLIGPSDDEQFIWLAGQGGAGFQTSPAVGQLIADVLLHGKTVPKDVDPKRFTGQENASELQAQ